MKAFRLAIFGRFDRAINQWLLTHSFTSTPQCSLAWWHQVLHREHLLQSNRQPEQSDCDEYSMEGFRSWVMQHLSHDRLEQLMQQLLHCQAGLGVFETTLAEMMGNPDVSVMEKSQEALDAWRDFLARMIGWLSPDIRLFDKKEEVNGTLINSELPTARHPQSIMSRELAIGQMLSIAQYFRHHEPSSPVPMLMERAVRWTGMSLDEWLTEMVRDESCLREINHVLKGPDE